MKKPNRKTKITVALLNIFPWSQLALTIIFFGDYVPKNPLEIIATILWAMPTAMIAVISVLVDVGYYFKYHVEEEKNSQQDGDVKQ